MTESSVQDRVAAGVDWLNANYPNWREEVTLPNFDIRSTCNCVLGQLFRNEAEELCDIQQTPGEVRGYDYALDIGCVLTGSEAISYGFDCDPQFYDYRHNGNQRDYSALQAEWTRVLSEPDA